MISLSTINAMNPILLLTIKDHVLHLLVVKIKRYE